MKHLVLHIIFLLMIVQISSQDSIKNVTIDQSTIRQKSFNKKRLEEYKNQDEFNYQEVKQEPTIFQKAWQWLGRLVKKVLRWFFDDINPAVGILKTVLGIIPYFILGLSLYFILKFFLRMNTSYSELSEGKINGVFSNEEEKLIKHENLEVLIQKAIQDHDFRLAIRYYYLFILKKLSEKEFIIWQQEKTNEDYIKELNNQSLLIDFKQSTRVYDFVWYGGFEVGEREFKKAEQLFLSLKQKING